MQGLIRPISLSLPILGSMFLLSCATLSKQQCLIGDWQTIGYNDGVAGYFSERLASHSKACAKAHVTPDYLAWERGRKLGLQLLDLSGKFAVTCLYLLELGQHITLGRLQRRSNLA